MSYLRQPTNGMVAVRVGQIVVIGCHDYKIIEIGLVHPRGDAFEIRRLPRSWMFGWRAKRTPKTVPSRRTRVVADDRLSPSTRAG